MPRPDSPELEYALNQSGACVLLLARGFRQTDPGRAPHQPFAPVLLAAVLVEAAPVLVTAVLGARNPNTGPSEWRSAQAPTSSPESNTRGVDSPRWKRGSSERGPEVSNVLAFPSRPTAR